MRYTEPSRSRVPDPGSVLIVAVWVLFLLGILAVGVGSLASRRVAAAERLRGRLQAYAAARAGVARAVAVLAVDTNAWDGLMERWADSAGDFAGQPCGDGLYTVMRVSWEGNCAVTNYGVSDEESRIDLNLADATVLQGVLEVAGGLTPEFAHGMATNIVASRNKQGIDGLQAEPTPFRCPEDLLTVPGMDSGKFAALSPYLSVHGGRRVNLNTAGDVVLRSLLRRGDPVDAARQKAVEELIRKVLQFRKGGGMFTTHVGPGMAQALEQVVALESDERALLYALSPWVTTASDRFRIVSGGWSDAAGRFSRRIECVWDRTTLSFESWHED